MRYEGNERREIRLSDEEIEAIARRVKKLAMDEIYAEIGKGVVKRVLWSLGLGGAAITLYLTAKGYIK